MKFIRGARIQQQIKRDRLDETTYTDLEQSTVSTFPDTDKRQNVVNQVNVSKIEFTPFLPNRNLLITARASSGARQYKPQVLFSQVEFQDEDTPDNVTIRATTNQDVNLLPIDLSENNCKVKCDCLDFYHRFSQFNYTDDSLYGDKPPTYRRKTDTRPAANPEQTPGLCKHLMKVVLELRDAGLIQR